MTTYRLPDGTEAPGATDERPPVTAWVRHPILGLIGLAPDRLTEVKPPLPPVPAVPAVLIGDLVWVRDDIVNEGPVFLMPGGPMLNWEELNRHADAQGKPIIPLAPDPTHDAPALPWGARDYRGGRLSIERNGSLLRIGGATAFSDVRMDQAVQGALAVLRAAREVEQP